jgi:hypothetical protein
LPENFYRFIHNFSHDVRGGFDLIDKGTGLATPEGAYSNSPVNCGVTIDE